jgi:UDPglucose 6-dehydrogenase
MRELLRTPLLVDLRNIYPPAEAEKAGLKLVGVGKPALG